MAEEGEEEQCQCERRVAVRVEELIAVYPEWWSVVTVVGLGHTHLSESEKRNGGVAQKALGMRIGFLDASRRHQLVRTRHRRSVKPLLCIVYFPR